MLLARPTCCMMATFVPTDTAVDAVDASLVVVSQNSTICNIGGCDTPRKKGRAGKNWLQPLTLCMFVFCLVCFVCLLVCACRFVHMYNNIMIYNIYPQVKQLFLLQHTHFIFFSIISIVQCMRGYQIMQTIYIHIYIQVILSETNVSICTHLLFHIHKMFAVYNCVLYLLFYYRVVLPTNYESQTYASQRIIGIMCA